MESVKKGYISVIIPVYNGEKFLESTISNICDSAYKKLEILLIDDGSCDSSAQICKSFVERDDRVRYFYQRNQGIVAGRNFGLKLATGEYICFCDQDDRVNKEIYSDMIKRIELDQSDMCMCGTAKFYKEKSFIFEEFEENCYKNEEIREKLLGSLIFSNLMDDRERIRINPSIWKCLIKKDIININQMKFRRFINYEDDWIFLIELLINCERVSTVKKIGYYWRTNLESESHAAKYVTNLEIKQKELIEYIKAIMSHKMPEEQIKDFENAQKCLDIIRIFENERSISSLRNAEEKKKYFELVINEMYTDGVKAKSNHFAKGCIRYKVIYLFVRKKKYMLAYYSNVWLQCLIRFLHKLQIGNKVESFLKS